MSEITKRRLRFLAGFAVYFGALWALWNTPVVYPIKIFVVLLHELSHGAVALATGGRIEGIVITAQEGGVCQCPGGSAFLTLSAGYLGSLLWGALILSVADMRGKIPQIAAGLIGVAVIAVTLLFVRNLFGLAFGAVFGIALVAAARRLDAGFNAALLTALGLTSCLYAILDIKSDILDRPGVMSDARMLAQLTHIPTLFWGILWVGLALVLSAWLFRRAFRRASAGPVGPKEVFEA
jgi:hypothetical protein